MRFGEKLKKVGAILTGLISVLSAAYLIAILWIEPIVFWEKSGIVWLVVTAVFFASLIGCFTLISSSVTFVEEDEWGCVVGIVVGGMGFLISIMAILAGGELTVYSWEWWAYCVSIIWLGILIFAIYSWVKEGFGSFFATASLGLFLTVLLLTIGVPVHSKRMKDLHSEVYSRFAYDGEYGDNFVYTRLEGGTVRVTLVKGEKELIVPETIEELPVSQLAFCSGVTVENEEIIERITLPASLKEIGWYDREKYSDVVDGLCLSKLKNLSSIYVAEGNTAYRFEQGCLIKWKTVTAVLEGGSIPETGVDDIASYVCYGRNCERMFIPANISDVSNLAFGGIIGLQELEVDSKNTVYHSAGNCVIVTKTKTLRAGCAGSVIPADGSVVKIGSGAFYSQESVKKIVIPNTIEEIEEIAFEFCSNMTEIVLPQSVKKIGDRAFAFCKNLSIRCETRMKPLGWSASWCGSYDSVKEIIWGYQG